MNVQELARKTEVQILAVFGILVLGGYYIYRKRFVDSARWAKATGNVPIRTGSSCPKGQVPCSNNTGICFDPKVNYVVDPCKSAIYDDTFARK